MEIENITLSSFFKELSNKLDNNELEKKDILILIDFYLSYKNLSLTPPSDMEQINNDNFMKYFSLGYYIYNFLM